MNIIITEKQNEFTDISVALCSAGTIEFSAISDLICNKSSASDVKKPPIVIRYQIPVNSVNRPARAIVRQIAKSFRREYLPAFRESLAPTIPPMDMMKRRGPKSQFGIPVMGSFA